MKTSRTDINRNKQLTVCPNSSFLGYSTYRLKYGDLFLYTEQYTDGTTRTRLAKYHGRIRPVQGTTDWLILAQVANHAMTTTFERWVTPADVIETTQAQYANQHILEFFESLAE